MLDERSNKLKAIMNNSVELEIYKSYKDMIEFYLKKSKEDISGIVGNVYVGSYYEEDFLEKIIDYYTNKELSFSKINVAFTKNEKNLFQTLLKRYIGECNVDIEKTTTMSAKKYMKQIFRQNENLKKRIKNDMLLKPIKELDDLEIKIDFSFKNGKWNYMQTISNNTNRASDWFTKIQFILDETNKEESKVHLLYKESDFLEDKGTFHLLEYLKNKYSTLEIHNIDKKTNVEKLCNYIETEAQVLENVV
ncbi:hypothetical protein CFSAN001627_19203 [Clostridium botulinum CFSAN001627]|uniref:Uncharacterized protein n=2 Tax=Clostridium botulinum TaxID=1491 RepID=M1ZV27_CLOBO|nr:hypothetical protein CFSAN001627_19203 [Clostridium botulinum CFSAN001627]